MRADRIMEIDAARGAAIILMVAYHFFFDLDYFGLAAVPMQSLFFVTFQRIVGILFVLIAGTSLALSESHNKEGYLHHVKRALRLAAVAALITFATWVYPHEGFIKFGIIHMLALSIFVAPFFFRFGRLNVILGTTLIIAGFYTSQIQTELPYFFWLGITCPGYEALDHYPMVPWFGVVLIGVYAGQSIFVNWKTGKAAARSGLLRLLSFLGRNSLKIYLVHQPLLVGILLLFRRLFP